MKAHNMHKKIIQYSFTIFALAILNLFFAIDSFANDANSINIIIDDITLPHESFPHGVPQLWPWAQKPSIRIDITVPLSWSQIIAWGQAYESASGNPSINSRIHIKDLKLYILSKTSGIWQLIQNSNRVTGAAYHEDFKDGIHIPIEQKNENSKGTSVQLIKGYNYHFWPTSGKADINVNEVKAVFVTVKARLICNDPNLPDDRTSAQLLLSVGADFWADKDSHFDYFKSSIGTRCGRFKFLKPEWQSYNMITLLKDQVLQNPPPIE